MVLQNGIVVPNDIVMLMLEAESPYNDGWTQEAAKDKLLAVRDYINEHLGSEDEKVPA